MDERTGKIRSYEDEVKRQRDAYGPGAEIPQHPIGGLVPGTLGVPVPQAAPERISQLCKQLAEATQQLSMARGQFNSARVQRDQAEGMFAKVVEELNYAIQEHREGTPENMPYPR